MFKNNSLLNCVCFTLQIWYHLMMMLMQFKVDQIGNLVILVKPLTMIHSERSVDVNVSTVCAVDSEI